jgi:hypothetical protein
VDITTLGIGIDSRQVDDGKKALDDFTQSADKAEKAAAGVGEGAKKGAAGAKDAGDSMAASFMKGMLGAQAIEKAVELAIDAVKQLYSLMMEAGEYADLADMTGASAVNMAKLQVAADIAGVSMQGMAGYLNQLTRVLSKTDEDSDKAARALARYGISMEDIRDLDPAEQFAKIGLEMGKYADSAQKTADMQVLMGRGAKEAIKALKVLSDGTKFHTDLTEEMIARTDMMSDSQAEFTARSRAAIQTVMTGFIPGLSALKGAIGDTALEMLGLGSKTDLLGANKGIEKFVTEGIKFIIGFTVPFELLGRLIEGAISAVRALAEASMAVAKLDWGGVVKAAEGHLDRLKELSERKFLGEKFQANLDAQTAAIAAASEEKKKIIVGETEAEIKARKEAQKAMEKAAKEAAKTAKWLADERAKIDMEEFDKERARDMAEFEDKYKREVAFMRKSEEEQTKMDSKNLENDAKEVVKIHEKAQALEEEIANHGKLKSEIAETAIVRLEEERIAEEGNEARLIQIDKEIFAMKRLRDAMKGHELQDAATKAAKKAQDEFEKAWEQVGQSLSDQLMKGSLKAADLMKNLFKTLVLRPMIMGAISGAGSSFMSGAVGGATGGAAGGGGGGIMGTAGSMVGSYAGSALFGGVGTAAASTYTGAMAAGLPVANAVGMGAGAGLAAVPVAGWIALAVLAAYYIYKKGGGPKVEGSAGYQAGDLIGRSGSEMDPQTMSAVKDLSAQYRRMTTMLGSTNATAEFGVGYSMDPRGDAPSMVHIRTQFSEYVNTEAGRTAEELAKALAEGSAKVMVEALRNSGMEPQMLEYFDKITAGMTDDAKLAAFEQVAAVGQFWHQLQSSLGGTLKQFTNISLAAAVSVAELSGGIQALSANVSTYAEHFLKPAEQESLKYQQIAATLNEAGSGWVGWSEALLRNYDKDFFRKVVEGLNLENEGDRMRYASLMKVAGAFAELKEAAAGAATAVETLAEKQAKALEKYNDALDVLSDAYDRQKDVLIGTRDAMHDATRSFLEFNDSLKVDESLSTLDPASRMWELQNQYGAARNKAEAGNYQAEDVARMQETARALLQGGREYYGSGEGYTELFNQITKEMEGAAYQTKMRENYAEASLKNLELSVGYLVNIDNHLIDVYTALTQFLSARNDLYTLGYPHAEGLSRVPFNNYPALLHKEEMVLPAQDSAFLRGLPDFSGELRALRQEVTALRKENRQDAGNTIGATFTAAQQAAEVQSEATIRAARQRVYQSRSRPVLA